MSASVEVKHQIIALQHHRILSAQFRAYFAADMSRLCDQADTVIPKGVHDLANQTQKSTRKTCEIRCEQPTIKPVPADQVIRKRAHLPRQRNIGKNGERCLRKRHSQRAPILLSPKKVREKQFLKQRPNPNSIITISTGRPVHQTCEGKSNRNKNDGRDSVCTTANTRLSNEAVHERREEAKGNATKEHVLFPLQVWQTTLFETK